MSSAKEFEKCYQDAYKVIDEGINLVTQGKSNEASDLFERGLSLIDVCLNVKIETLDIGTEKTQLFTEMQSKMRTTRKEVLLHFSSANTPNTASSSARNDNPPSYDEYLSSIQSTGSGQNQSYPSLDSMTLELDPNATPSVTPILSPQNGERIFHLENGVQIFFVYSNGRVTSPSYPSFLSVFLLRDPIKALADSEYPGTRGFLQVGEWSYPLIPSQSPVLHSFYGAYMFPDVSNPVPGTSVGILIPDSVTKEDKDMFEQILMQMTSYHEQLVPKGVDADKEKAKIAEKTTGQRVAEGAEAVSRGVAWGTEKLSEWITFGSDKLKESIAPENQSRPVDPKIQKTVKIARNVSGCAVKVSGFLLGQVGKATMALGKWAAPSLQHHGTKAFAKFTGQSDKDADGQVGGAMEVAAGALKGASTVYMSLESAAANLAYSISNNTVKVVTHKYGDDYGKVVDDTLYTVGQTAMAGHNISSMGVKGIAKKAAKDAGKAVVSNYDRGEYSDKSPDVMEGIEEGSDASKSLKEAEPKKK